MFSQDAYDNLKLIENTFIVGLNNENISSLLSSSSSFNLNTEILFSFPENKTKINSHVLDVMNELRLVYLSLWSKCQFHRAYSKV